MLTTATTKKDNSAQRKILLSAVVLALLVHGLLLALFFYKPPPGVYSKAGTAGVSFMDIRNYSPEKQRQMLNWLEYHQPALISAPHARHGYNQLAPYTEFRKARRDKACRPVLPEAAKSSPGTFEELKMHDKPETVFSDSFVFHSFRYLPKPPAKPAEKSSRPETKYPLVKNGDSVLKFSFSPYILKDADKLKLKKMLINYDLTHSKLLPRISVADSSGDHDFDMRVLRELSLELQDISLGRREFNLSIQWRKEVTE